MQTCVRVRKHLFFAEIGRDFAPLPVVPMFNADVFDSFFHCLEKDFRFQERRTMAG